MVSIQFMHASPRTEKADSSSCPTQEDVCAFAQRYLEALVPQFDLYGLASSYTGDYPGEPGGHYELYYGVPVGDYYGAARINFTFSSIGELDGVVFPQDVTYEQMTKAEKDEVAAKLPGREELEQYAREQMEEKYGDRLVSMEIENIYFEKEGSAYRLYIRVGVSANLAENMPVGYAESVVYPVE